MNWLPVYKSMAAAVVLVAIAAAGAGFGRNAQPPAAPPDKAAPAKGATPKQDVVAGASEVPISGRVLDANGKPVPGARLFTETMLTPEPRSMSDVGLVSLGQSGGDGSFRVTLKSQSKFPRRYLGAFAPGYGIDWVEWAEVKASDDVTLRLVNGQPVSGRVLNTEGKPLAGVAVAVVAVGVPVNDKLDDYLAGWTKDWQDSYRALRKQLVLPLDAFTGAVKTDADGKFVLTGVGPDRIVNITASGAGMAKTAGVVITRQGFNAKPYNEGVREVRPFRSRRGIPILYGPELTIVAEPGVTIKGVVKDAGTGAPLSQCHIATYFGHGDAATATTDANGEYTLTGIPKEKTGYSVTASMPKVSSTYLLRRAQAADAEGFNPIRLDIDLIKGAVVTGRITDKQTGKGVVAGIRFAPLTDNKFFSSKPGFDNYLRDRTMQETDADGRFRLVTIPGRALVLAQVRGNVAYNDQILCPYRLAVPDEGDRSLFKYDKTDDQWTIATAGGTEFLMTENAVKVIDIKADSETTIELCADRGVTAKIAVQDADGKPLPGAWAAGLTEHWPITYRMNEPTATVYALTPEKPRTLFLYHPGKKLGGSVTVRGDEANPVVAKLGPVGAVAGRLHDADGNPLSGVDVSAGPAGTVARELYRFARPSPKPVRTDKDGRFTLSDVVPGMPFYLDVHREKESFGGKPKIGLLTVKPAETLDLGDRTMELLR